MENPCWRPLRSVQRTSHTCAFSTSAMRLNRCWNSRGISPACIAHVAPLNTDADKAAPPVRNGGALICVSWKAAACLGGNLIGRCTHVRMTLARCLQSILLSKFHDTEAGAASAPHARRQVRAVHCSVLTVKRVQQRTSGGRMVDLPGSLPSMV
jgi:hypothetical protein